MLLFSTIALALAAPSVRTAYATSGDATLSLDGSLSTGWVPVGQALGEGWILELEEPTVLTRLELRACPGQDSFDVAVWFDGHGAGRAVRVDPGLPRYVVHTASRPVRKIDLRVVDAPGQVCLAEVKAAGPDGSIPLAEPPRVRGRVAASSVQEPATAWGPRQAFDGRLDTAFVSAISRAGESLWLTLEEDLDLIGVEVWLGDQRSPGPQYPPGVPERVSLSVDGSAGRSHTLSGPGPHLLPVSGRVRGLVLELGQAADASPGRGTAVAEVRLWTPDGPVLVDLPPPHVPAGSIVADRVLEPVCGPSPGLPTRLRVRPNGSVHLAWNGEDAGGTWVTLLEGTWSLPQKEGPTWSVRVDGALETWRTLAAAGPVATSDGPTLGGTLRITPVDELGDGLVASGEGDEGCPDATTGPGEVIVQWNDAAQRMR